MPLSVLPLILQKNGLPNLGSFEYWIHCILLPTYYSDDFRSPLNHISISMLKKPWFADDVMSASCIIQSPREASMLKSDQRIIHHAYLQLLIDVTKTGFFLLLVKGMLYAATVLYR